MPLLDNGQPTADKVIASFINEYIFLSSITLDRSRTSPQYLHVSFMDRQTIGNYFESYKSINNVLFDELNAIHFFGVHDMPWLPTNTYAFAVPFFEYYDANNNVWNNPPMCFFNVVKVTNGFTNQNYDYRQKIKAYMAAHEIAHARGLIDEINTDEVHQGHWNMGHQPAYCMMEPVNTIPSIDNLYPPKFCWRHSRIFGDSLSHKVQKALNIPENYNPEEK